MVKRKEKIGIQVSHAPFLLFIGTSILIHGVGLLILVLSNQNLTSIKEEPKSTPIDFVLVPPEDSPEEPPPDTKRLAINNSVAKGKNVEPELPSATNKIGNEEAIATSKSSPGNQKNIQDKSLTPTPSRERVKPLAPVLPKPEPPAPVKSPVALSEVPKPEITPPRERVKPIAPVLPKPEAKPEPPAPVKPPVALSKVPKPEIATPTPTPPRERLKPLRPLLPKPEAKPEHPAPVKPPVALSKVPKPEIASPTPTPPRARLKPLRPLLPKPEPQSLSESNSSVAPVIKPIPQSEKKTFKKNRTSY